MRGRPFLLLLVGGLLASCSGGDSGTVQATPQQAKAGARGGHAAPVATP